MSRQTYVNPVWSQDFPDPYVLAHQGRYYAYATETGRRGAGFQVMESSDLVHWTHKGTAFTPPWSRVHLWAPEVVAYRGLLHMTYSARDPRTGKHHIAIATARNPLGPFQHQGILVRGDRNRVGVIDATLFFEGKDAYILYSEEEPRRIVVRKMKGDLMGTEGNAIELIRPTEGWEKGVTEAPTLVKHGGKYHLIYSGGWFQSNKVDACYCVAHAVASSLTGPYTKTGQILSGDNKKVFGPGHQCVLSLKSGEQWMFYHAWDDQNEPRYGSNPLGRTLRMDRMVWVNDRPKVVGPTVTAQPAPTV